MASGSQGQGFDVNQLMSQLGQQGQGFQGQNDFMSYPQQGQPNGSPMSASPPPPNQSPSPMSPPITGTQAPQSPDVSGNSPGTNMGFDGSGSDGGGGGQPTSMQNPIQQGNKPLNMSQFSPQSGLKIQGNPTAQVFQRQQK